MLLNVPAVSGVVACFVCMGTSTTWELWVSKGFRIVIPQVSCSNTLEDMFLKVWNSYSQVSNFQSSFYFFLFFLNPHSNGGRVSYSLHLFIMHLKSLRKVVLQCSLIRIHIFCGICSSVELWCEFWVLQLFADIFNDSAFCSMTLQNNDGFLTLKYFLEWCHITLNK